MSAQHTPWHPDGDVPAPWVVEETDTRCFVLDACGGFVADCTNGFDGDEGWVMSASVGPLGDLISAAPELLAACIAYLADRKEAGCTADSAAVKAMRAAIAKATGGAA